MLNTVAAARESGITIVGYVSTQYSGRDPDSVKQDITRYKNWYNIDGIFLDEVSIYCSVLDYYRDIDAYIHSDSNSLITVLNTGNYPGECYMSVGDIVVYEQPYSIYRNTSPPSWVFNYSSDRFWHIVWKTTPTQMRSVIDISRNRNAGYVYVTNDDLPNPYDTLPSYWSAELDKLGKRCP